MQNPGLVYFPKPVIAKENIEGHIIEQHKPPLINENTANMPVENKPTSINITPNTPKVTSVRTGFCLTDEKSNN